MSRIIHFLRRVVQAVSDAFATLLIALVRVYQHTLGGVLGGHCRFEPTCSNYAIGAIRNCGPVKGLFLAAWRILRCNPWGGSGYDPPPEPKRPGPDDATPCGSRE